MKKLKDIERPEMPILCWAIGGLGIIWGIISVMQWGFNYPDFSQLMPNLGLAAFLVYVAYGHWYRKLNDKYKEHTSYRIDCIEWPDPKK